MRRLTECVYRLLPMLILLILPGCGFFDWFKSEESLRAEQASRLGRDLCYTGERPATAVAHQNIEGSIIVGDVVNVASASRVTYASALARTKRPVAVTTTQGSVVVPVCGPFGCFPRQVPVQWREEFDLSSIYGLGRVPVSSVEERGDALEAARELAVEACDELARDYAAENDIRYSYVRMKCEPKAVQFCEL